MNDVFKGLLDICVVVYLDDILVYSENPAIHTTHVIEVLRRLRANNLYAKVEKCEFSVTTTEFLGFIISPDSLRMDELKIQVIQDWPVPRKVKHIQSFLGCPAHTPDMQKRSLGLEAHLRRSIQPAQASFQFGPCTPFLLTTLDGSASVVLRYSWLHRHNLLIDWVTHDITFRTAELSPPTVDTPRTMSSNVSPKLSPPFSTLATAGSPIASPTLEPSPSAKLCAVQHGSPYPSSTCPCSLSFFAYLCRTLSR